MCDLNQSPAWRERYQMELMSEHQNFSTRFQKPKPFFLSPHLFILSPIRRFWQRDE